MFKLIDGKTVKIGMWISESEACYEVIRIGDSYVEVCEVVLNEIQDVGPEPYVLGKSYILTEKDLKSMKEV